MMGGGARMYPFRRVVVVAVLLMLFLPGETYSEEGKAQSIDELAHALLAGSKADVKSVAAEVKTLSHGDLQKLIEAVRTEYRALANNKGVLTRLTVSGTYKLDQAALVDYVYADSIKHRREWPGGFRDKSKEEFRTSAAQTIADRFKKGNPMVLVLKSGGTFDITGTEWETPKIRQGTWEIYGKALELTITSVDRRPLPPQAVVGGHLAPERPARVFGLQILWTGRLKGGHFTHMNETWEFERE